MQNACGLLQMDVDSDLCHSHSSLQQLWPSVSQAVLETPGKISIVRSSLTLTTVSKISNPTKQRFWHGVACSFRGHGLFFGMVTAPSSHFGLLTGRVDLAPLGTDPSQQIYFQNLRYEVNTSIWTFNAEQWNVFNKTFGEILPSVTSSHAMDPIPSAISRFNHSQRSIHKTSTSLSSSSTTPSPSSPSFHSHCSYPFRLFLLQAPAGASKTVVSKSYSRHSTAP